MASGVTPHRKEVHKLNTSRFLKVLSALSCVAVAEMAHAQFSDDFESYPAGSAIAGQGGWTEWTGSTDVSGHISTLYANSGTKSLEIVGAVGGSTGGGDDTVHTFTGATTGKWVFKVMTYVPTTATGTAWIILLNTYPASVNPHWSVQVELNANNNTVYSDHLVTTTLPLIKGQWVEFRVEVDLNADQAKYFYNNTQLGLPVSWKALYGATGGAQNIAAVDLYGGEPATGGTSGTYYDDISLQPAPSATTILATSTNLAPGLVISGTPADMNASDDIYYVLRPGIVFSTTQSPIVLTLSGNAPGATASDLKMVVESKANQANIGETIEAWNFTTSAWVQLNQTVLTTSDVVKTLTIANPNQFIGPSNEVRTRILYKTVGPVFSYPWRVSIDEATWRYTP